MKKEKRKYASVVGDEGVNYRDIADVMTELGFDMNHSLYSAWLDDCDKAMA